MGRKGLRRVLFLLALIVSVFIGWQISMPHAGLLQAETILSHDTGTKAEAGNLNLILLNNQGYKKKRKGPVKFTHKKHVYQYGVVCWDCHHDYQDGQNVWVPWGETKRCRQCHDPKSKEHNKIMLQKAFHFQCKGCHKDLAKKKMKTGAYRKCGGCHLKTEAK